VLRERFADGFRLWQSVFANAFADTDAFHMVAHHYGEMLNDFTLLRPIKLPDEWINLFVEMMADATKELEKSRLKQHAAATGDIAIVAGKNRTDAELMEIANRMSSD